MDVLRDRFAGLLREADEHGRLRILHPRVPGLGDGEQLNVHSKLMVVDDRLVRVGSANLSDRSMGLDTECDLAIEARRPEDARAIARSRDDLLAEHLGTDAERVEEALAREGSLVGIVGSLSGGERRLAPRADARAGGTLSGLRSGAAAALRGAAPAARCFGGSSKPVGNGARTRHACRLCAGARTLALHSAARPT
jgi:hypothetical protein